MQRVEHIDAVGLFVVVERQLPCSVNEEIGGLEKLADESLHETAELIESVFVTSLVGYLYEMVQRVFLFFENFRLECHPCADVYVWTWETS